MATSLAEVSKLLQSAGIEFRPHEGDSLLIPAETRTYKDADGDQILFLVLQVLEGGEYLQLFCPMAFKVEGPHVDVFLKACAIVQWRTKLIQFEYDPRDGEIRPTIELPLEDSKVTARQLLRCVRGMVMLMDTYYPVLDRARTEGIIDFPASETTDVSQIIDSLAEQYPAEMLGEALRRSIAMRQRPIPS
ncbi:MAG: YbjN domain-containing protein [Gemmatimonadota bacterium]|nr:YbjN domain-containing protein [Gemmatimonadota bacterium]